MGGEFEKPLNKQNIEIITNEQNGKKQKGKNSSNTKLKTEFVTPVSKSKFASGTKLVKVTDTKTKRGISHKKMIKKFLYLQKIKKI